jgi:hypothetical protein
MPDAVAPISPGTGLNVRTIRYQEWVADPTTGIGAWVDTQQQVLVLADKRGDLVGADDRFDDVVTELREIRNILEQLMLRLA